MIKAFFLCFYNEFAAKSSLLCLSHGIISPLLLAIKQHFTIHEFCPNVTSLPQFETIWGQGTGHFPAGIFKNIISNVTKTRRQNSTCPRWFVPMIPRHGSWQVADQRTQQRRKGTHCLSTCLCAFALYLIHVKSVLPHGWRVYNGYLSLCGYSFCFWVGWLWRQSYDIFAKWQREWGNYFWGSKEMLNGWYMKKLPYCNIAILQYCNIAIRFFQQGEYIINDFILL